MHQVGDMESFFISLIALFALLSELIHATQIGMISNSSLTIHSPTITVNGSNCDDCLCTMIQSSTILSLNCLLLHSNRVSCTLFSHETYATATHYHMDASINSTFYFRQLPPISTTAAATTSLTTSRPRSWIFGNITRSGDPIVGLYNTTAGVSSGGKDGRYPNPKESAEFAIDGNATTKYVNFGAKGWFNVSGPNMGVGTGFYVTPNISDVSIATAIQFATANDYSNRDPITITLEGTNATSLDLGSSWTLIYNGSTGINASIAPSRNTYMRPQNFSNTKAFRSYRLLVTSQRGSDLGVQYSEAQIIGYYYV